jgi:hypothetical protein
MPTEGRDRNAAELDVSGRPKGVAAPRLYALAAAASLASANMFMFPAAWIVSR